MARVRGAADGEEQLHRAVVEYLRVAIPPDGPVWLHPYNGGKRSKGEAGKGVALGVMPGAPDLLFLSDRPFAIELKSHTGRVSPAQRDMHARLGAAGVPVFVCRSLDEVRAALSVMVVPTRERAI